MSQRRLYYLRPIRSAPAEVPLTLETAPDRLLWLDAHAGVRARAGIQFASASQQSLTRASNPSLQTGGGNFVCGGWYWLSTTGTDQILLGKADTSINVREYQLFYRYSTDRYAFLGSTDGTAAGNTIVQESTISPGTSTWRFIFAYFNAATGTLGISVDNTSFDTAPLASIRQGNIDFRIATRPNSTLFGSFLADSVFIGKPSDLSVSARNALRDALYNGGNGQTYDTLPASLKSDLGLVSWWDMDELTGNQLDRHGTNDLTAINNPALIDGKAEGPARDLNPARSWSSQQGSVIFTQETFAHRPTWRSTGHLAFDGVNDQMSCPGPLVGNRAAFTLLARVRLAALPISNPAVVYTEADAGGNVVSRLTVTPMGHVVASYRPQGGSLVSATSAGTLAINTEVVIGVRRNGTELQVFIDGSPSGPSATIDAGTDLSGAIGRVGGPVESSGLAHLNGQIGALFASGQALTNAQISSIFNDL